MGNGAVESTDAVVVPVDGVVNGGTKPVGGSSESPAPFVKTWVLTGSLGTPSARVEER